MNPTIRDLRHESHNRSCSARAISRLVVSVIFENAYDRAESDQQEAVVKMIRALDLDGIKRWLNADRRALDIAGMTLRELRVVGQQLGVKDYHRLQKSILLSEITNASKRACNEIAAAPL